MPLNPGFTDATVAATVHAQSHNQLGAALDQLHFNVKFYGAVGDGVNDDTTAIQAAFDAAYTAKGVVYFPPGSYLCGTINWKYTPFYGAGSSTFINQGTTIVGKASQDIIHIDSTVDGINTGGWFVRDITLQVNDTVNAAASFPQRGGVGNAAFAGDKPNGADGANLTFLLGGEFTNVVFRSSSTTAGGQNNSCGFYLQSGSSIMRWDGVGFYRLKYGYWHHYPTSNLASYELARDHDDIGTLYANGCGNAVRFVNAGAANISNLVIHGVGGAAVGFQAVGAASAIRANNTSLTFGNIEIEATGTAWSTGFVLEGAFHTVARLNVYMVTGAVAIACDYSVFGGIGIGSSTNTLTLTGSKNRILELHLADSPTTSPTVTNTGDGNLVALSTGPSGQHPALRLYNSAGGYTEQTPVAYVKAGGSGNYDIGSVTSAGDVYLDFPTTGNLYLRCTGSAPNVAMDQNSRVGIGVTSGLASQLDVAGNIASRSVAITYSASMTPSASASNNQKIVVTNGTAMTINAPASPANGQTLTLDIKNSSGGAMGAITWNAVFLLAGAFTNPANTKRRTITFYFDGTNWVETNRAAADI